MYKKKQTKRRAFTLTELLVVIGIILVLATLINSATGAARASADRVQCLSNIRSLGQAALIYAQNDSKGRLPWDGVKPENDTDKTKANTLGLLYDPIYFNDLLVFGCPNNKRKRISLPTKGSINSDGKSPYYIEKSSYSLVLGPAAAETQTMAYPADNIILIENFDTTAPSFQHDKYGIAAFHCNGKCRMIYQNSTPSAFTMLKNTSKDGVATYDIDKNVLAS